MKETLLIVIYKSKSAKLYFFPDSLSLPAGKCCPTAKTNQDFVRGCGPCGHAGPKKNNVLVGGSRSNQLQGRHNGAADILKVVHSGAARGDAACSTSLPSQLIDYSDTIMK